MGKGKAVGRTKLDEGAFGNRAAGALRQGKAARAPGVGTGAGELDTAEVNGAPVGARQTVGVGVP